VTPDRRWRAGSPVGGSVGPGSVRITRGLYKARVRRRVGKSLLRESVATDAEVTIRQVWVVRDDAWRMGLFVSYRNAAQSVPGTMRIEGSNRRLSLHWTSLAEGNANFSIVIVFRYADDLMVGFEHREEAERLQGIN
jgi:hypothetical protein